MCGIAGFVDSDLSGGLDSPRVRADEQVLRQMCAVIRHRGPDDEGLRVEPGVGLGMRRLSIIDLATGHQPIRNEDASVWVVFNGEIYNFRQLRADLLSRGHRFYTSTDTEVIVHAYDEWGEGAFARLRGMFAVALWDRRTSTLLLARDRLGIKPLYYTERAGRLYYASELKSLVTADAVERAIDPEALEHYLAFLYTPGDRAIFPGVRKLEPGHLLRWRAGQTRVAAYWTPPRDEVRPPDEATAAEALLEHLRDAVRSHLVSDVPLGAFLSGGIDSSLVVALMAEASDRPVKTFSIGFDEPEWNELEAARAVATHFGTEHHEFVVRPDALGIAERLVHHFDEPFGDASAVPTWYVSAMARQHVTVVLSGDGGDELFGGYDRYIPHPVVAGFDRLAFPGAGRIAGLIAGRLPHGARGRRFLQHVSQPAVRRYVDAVSFFTPDDRDALLTPEVRASNRLAPEERLAALFARTAHLPLASRQMRADLASYLPDDILTKVDRMSMAHSIESRVPLLDHRLVEHALALPPGLKIREGVRKYLLKAVAGRLLPAAVLDRPKRGFAVPLSVWCRGGLREAFTDVLQSSRHRQRGFFQAREVDRLLAEHLSGRRNHELRLWQLFMFELWQRQYLDDAPRPASFTLPLAVHGA
jgi:asparagine synthase (glutamine-hydrolysing)